MSQIISREDARAQELKQYFTGEPCKHGHIAPRFVSTGGCKECLAQAPRMTKFKGHGRVNITIPAALERYINLVVRKASSLTFADEMRCKTDGDFNLWIDEVHQGKFDTYEDMERARYDILVHGPRVTAPAAAPIPVTRQPSGYDHVAALCRAVPQFVIDMCQQNDANELWIGGAYQGKFESRGALERHKWKWLISSL